MPGPANPPPGSPGGPDVTYGVVIGMLNLDLAWQLEIERAAGDGTGSPDTTTSELIDVVPGWTRKYVDERDAGSGNAFYRVRTNLSGCSAGPWTSWKGASPEPIPVVLPELPGVPPVVVARWEADQTSDTTSKATLEVIDFEDRVTDLQYNLKQGQNASFDGWVSTWDTTTGNIGSDKTLTRSETVDLHVKHNTMIKARVKWDTRDAEGGQSPIVLPTLTMDIDRTPEVRNFTINVGSSDGSVFMDGRGDDDVDTIYARVATGSPPSDPDGTETDGTAGEVKSTQQTLVNKDTGLDVSKGDTVYGKARGENSSGTLGPVVSDQLDRFDFDNTAEVNTLMGSIDEPDGSVIVAVGGDDDTDTVYVRVDENQDPADPDGTESNTVAGEGVVNARTGVVDTDLQVDENSQAHIKARGANSGTLGPVKEGRVERPPADVVTWELDHSKSGNVGTITLTVEDPETRVTELANARKIDETGFGSWSTGWDTSTGTVGTDTTLTRTRDIGLTEKHNVAIKVRIKYTDRNGNTRTLKPASVSFDVDQIAELGGIELAVDDTQGDVKLSWAGDDDTTGVRYRINKGSFPVAPDGSATDLTATGRAGTTDTGTNLSVGEQAYVKAAGEDSGGNVGPVREGRISWDSGEQVPVVDADGTISGSTGTLQLTITDPQTRVTDVSFAKKTGPGGFGSFLTTWDSSTGTVGTDTDLSRSENITLSEKHLVAIKYRIQYTDKSGGTEVIKDTVDFDMDEIPELTTLSATANDDGTVTVTYGGDFDTGSAVVAWGSNISDADDTIDGRTGSVTSTDTLAEGQSVTVTVTPWTGSGGNAGTGTSGTAKDATASYRTDTSPNAALDTFLVTALGDDGTQLHWDLSWTVNSQVADGSHNLEIRFYKQGSFLESTNVSDPATTTSLTDQTTTGGDGTFTQEHHAEALLQEDSGGATLDTKTNYQLDSDEPA